MTFDQELFFGHASNRHYNLYIFLSIKLYNRSKRYSNYYNTKLVALIIVYRQDVEILIANSW